MFSCRERGIETRPLKHKRGSSKVFPPLNPTNKKLKAILPRRFVSSAVFRYPLTAPLTAPLTGNLQIAYLYIRSKVKAHGILETIRRVLVHQKERPQCTTHSVDEVHARDQPSFADHVPDRHYHHYCEALVLQTSLTQEIDDLLCGFGRGMTTFAQ